MSQIEDQDSLSIKPSQEDIEFRQRKGQTPRVSSSSATETSTPRTGGGTTLLLTLGIFALIGFSGWLYLQLGTLQQMYDAQEKELISNSQSVHQLKEQLNLTGENANSSVTALQATLKNHDSEIRKLWDVSNKRNKTWIQNLESGQAALKKQQTESDKQIATLLNEQKQLSKKLVAADKKISEVKKGQSDVDEQFLAIRAEIEAVRTDMGSVPSSVQKKFDEIDKALAAIDATRIKQAKNITDLGKEVRSLQSKIQPDSGQDDGLIAQ